MSIKQQVHEDRIVITAYPYKMSSGHLNPIIYWDQINELLLNRNPPELIRFGREVIFLDPSEPNQLKQLEAYALKKNISLTARPDIWSMLTRPYLDEIFTSSDEAVARQQLVTNFIKEVEIEAIRKKIADTLLMYNVILRETQVLSHFDVLMSRKKYALGGLTENYYWWTMKIALRNYFPES